MQLRLGTFISIVLVLDAALVQGQRPRLGLQLGSDVKLRASLSRDGKFLFTGSSGYAPAARLYDVATGSLIRTFVGQTGTTMGAVALCPDGVRAATSSDDKKIRIWNIHTGKQLKLIEAEGFPSLKFLDWSPDGKFIATSSLSLTPPIAYNVKVWNSTTGALAAKFDGTPDDLPCRFSPDGKHLCFYGPAVVGAEATLAKVTVADFKVVRRYRVVGTPVDFAATRDNKSLYVTDIRSLSVLDESTGQQREVASYSADTFVQVNGDPWYLKVDSTGGHVVNAATSLQVGTYRPSIDFYGWSASGDGRFVATCGEDSVSCYDVSTGNKILETKGLTTSVRSIFTIGEDGVGLATESSLLPIWSLKAGRHDLIIRGEPTAFDVATACPSRGLLVTGGEVSKLTIRSLANGSKVGEIQLENGECFDARFSPNGKWLAVSSWSWPGRPAPNTPLLRVYDVATWKVIKSWEAKFPDDVRFSSDSRYLAVASNLRARLFDTGTWEEREPLGSEHRSVERIEFTPHGGELWASTLEGPVIRSSLSSGKPLPELVLGNATVAAIGFSPTGDRFAAYALFDAFAIYDGRTHKPLVTLDTPPESVNTLVFIAGGRFLLGGLSDGTVRIWNSNTGRIVATFVSFNDGTWATVDPEGRFDASNGGDVQGLFWVLGDTPLALSQFKSYYYDPHLLAKILGFDSEKPRPVPDLNGIGLYPAVTVRLNPRTHIATVTVSDQGGGIGVTELSLNGVKIGTHPAPPKGTKKLSFEVNTAAPGIVSRLLPRGGGGANRLEAAAYNAAESIRGRMNVGVGLAGSLTTPPSHLYLLAVGANYPGTNRTLRYPESDAEAFAAGIELAAEELLGKARVHISLLASKDQASVPTKTHLLSAMAHIAKLAKPVDVVIVYFSGHGVARAANRGGYFYLTAEAGNADPENDPLASKYTLSSLELAAWLQGDVKAAKRAIILDTCASGAAAADLTLPRALPRDLELAWEQLKDNAGLYVLAGCAADKVSYEATNVGHGLLTYSLLEAIDQAKPAALADDGFLEIDQWFNYAETRVHGLMDELGLIGVQKPEKRAQANAGNYPVGLVNAKVLGKLGLPLPGPVLVLDTFRDAENDDPIHLSEKVEAALVDGSPGKGPSPAAYWPNLRHHEKALELRGSYRIAGGSVTVNVRLMRYLGPDVAERVLDTYEVTGPEGQPAALAAAIVGATYQRIQQDWERLNRLSAQ